MILSWRRRVLKAGCTETGDAFNNDWEEIGEYAATVNDGT
jgi:hypothetical protein